MVIFEQKWMYSGKTGCTRQSGCIQAFVVVFGKVWYWGKSSCIRAKVVAFVQKWYSSANGLYSG